MRVVTMNYICSTAHLRVYLAREQCPTCLIITCPFLDHHLWVHRLSLSCQRNGCATRVCYGPAHPCSACGTAHTHGLVRCGSFFPLRRQEYPTRRCCELRSGENPRETIPRPACPKCSPLPTGDWGTQRQHMSVAPPERLDHGLVRCSVRTRCTGTHQTEPHP